jgi:hypothetical protein
MAMQGYFDVFPEKRTTELRTATFANRNADDPLPDGMFIFTEYFCTDLRCDCQRVLVKVFHARSEDAPADEVATMSYTKLSLAARTLWLECHHFDFRPARAKPIDVSL